MSVKIKNCGMRDAEAIAASVANGASFIGFIHYPPSKRFIDIRDAAKLARDLPDSVAPVAVMVNPSDDEIAALMHADYAQYLQLHGDETIERVQELKGKTDLPIIKAVGIREKQDVKTALSFAPYVDALLFDTKHESYGGTGESFDWSLLQNIQLDIPWFLSGGLHANNVAQALRISRAPMIDVSSGIEREAGVKDSDKIKQFNETVLAYERE